jgi:tetratricopeptide (TPR) repeat protein/TolA-binding protein
LVYHSLKQILVLKKNEKNANRPKKMKIFPLALFLFVTLASKTHFGYCYDMNFNRNIEKGYDLLNEGNLEGAKKIFISESRSPLLLIHLYSELGLAKIAREEKKYKIAKGHLDQLKEEDLKTLSDLWHEWLWTQSDLHYQMGDYDKALEFLERAIPKRNYELAPFGPKSLLLQIMVWQKKGEAATDIGMKKKAALEAVNAYKLLEEFYPPFSDPKQASALYSLKACLFQDPQAYREASEHFKQINRRLESASCLIQEGSEDSLKEAGYLLENEDSPQAELLRAEYHIKMGEALEAKTILFKNTLPPPFHEKQLFLLGKLAYEEAFTAAPYFEELFQTYPASPLVPDALYWAARSAEDSKKLAYYTRLYQEFKDHPLAPEAYFYCYNPQEYLLGNRTAIKHLHAFKNLFPNSPLLLNALYLEGFDHLHDRRSPEGKWLSRKNLFAAIDAFMEVEVQFDRLKENPELKNMAKLERAKTNFLIASQARGSKQSIYLDYAATVFQEILADQLPSLEEEALYYSALILWHKGNPLEAKEGFQVLISKSPFGYYRSKSLYQLGIIEKELKSYPQAILFFGQALQEPSYLSIDERLDILIEKSESLRLNGDLDSAMLQLSEVVDYHAVSSLRLKAMYLRAEIYAEQGRLKLARKQLESLSLKGGSKDPWALKAKEKLQQEYGFD